MYLTRRTLLAAAVLLSATIACAIPGSPDAGGDAIATSAAATLSAQPPTTIPTVIATLTSTPVPTTAAPIPAPATSPAAPPLATVTEQAGGETYYVITPQNAAQLRRLDEQTIPGDLLGWAPAAQAGRIAVMQSTGVALLWTIGTRDGPPSLPVTEPLNGVRFSPDGNVLALLPMDPEANIELWELINLTSLDTWNGRIAGASGIAFSPDFLTFATSHREGSLQWWDSKTGQTRRVFDTAEVLGEGASAFGVEFSPDGRTIAAFASDPDGVPTVLMWNLESGEALDSFDPQGLIAGPVAYPILPEGWPYLVWVSRGSVILVDLRSGEELQHLSHQDFVMGIAISPDGNLIATSSSKTINDAMVPVMTIWDARAGTEVATLTGFDKFPQKLAFSPDGTHLAVSVDGSVEIWAITP